MKAGLGRIVVLVLVLTVAVAAYGEVVQRGHVRVDVSGKLSPQTLPRTGSAPIAVSIGGRITTTDGSASPTLKTLTIDINRKGRIDSTGLPVCPYRSIQPASSTRALSACRSSLVGSGSFSAEIALEGQDPYRTKGTLLAFNGRKGGKPVLYGQIYAPRPFAASFVIVFAIEKAKGQFGTALVAELPPSLRSWGNLTGIELKLSRPYSYKGKRRSYLSAGCPAPKGFETVPFTLARASFGFAGGPILTSTLTRSCRARG